MNTRYTTYIKTAIGLFLFFVVPAVFNNAAAQNAVAESSTGAAPYVFLNWTAWNNAEAYNIYRKTPGEADYPHQPVNTVRVHPITACPEITALLIKGTDSTNWWVVARGLADSVLFNPCNINMPGLAPAKAERRDLLAKSLLPVSIITGTGYEDHSVVAGTKYLYKIVALSINGRMLGVVEQDIAATAGQPLLLPAPTGIITEPGDGMNRVMWQRVGGASGYEVERAGFTNGPFQRVNPSAYSTLYTHHLNGDTLVPSAQGYTDLQVYDSAGKPTTHKVLGVNITGPTNGITYYYRVAALDFFNHAGQLSLISGPTKARDTTPPAVPGNLVTAVDNIHGYVRVSWTQVVKDIKGRWEEPDSLVTYKLYRFASASNPNNQNALAVFSVQGKIGFQTVAKTDASPGLRSQYGNRTWWYRVRSVDNVGNISVWSAAVSAIVKDTTPPRIVTGLTATGFPDHISLTWTLNTEPDMSAYMVYRSLCHLGAWVNCTNLDTCKTWYQGSNPSATAAPISIVAGRGVSYPCPCSGAFVFLGTITQDSAKRANAASNFYYNDYTVPPGSPLCYAYWIKAKDSSGNLSGAFPIPSAQEQQQIVCVHLRDTTPPEPAVITSLDALPERILVSWVGPPSQDIRAYHVYRAEGIMPGQEPPLNSYTWAGGMTVELPPKTPKVMTAPYIPPNVLPCDSIPVQAMPWMSVGSFEDKHVRPKVTYWYKVVGIDYAGNQTQLSKAAPVSTFTFSEAGPQVPQFGPPTVAAQPWGVQLSWSPAVNAAELGVIVYRGNSASGPFNPIVTAPVKGSTFLDTQVVQGQTYYYEIAVMAKTGHLSALSPYQSITP